MKSIVPPTGWKVPRQHWHIVVASVEFERLRHDAAEFGTLPVLDPRVRTGDGVVIRDSAQLGWPSWSHLGGTVIARYDNPVYGGVMLWLRFDRDAYGGRVGVGDKRFGQYAISTKLLVQKPS